MSEDQRFLIAGLGNPGLRYSRNRHNCGYLVIDELLQRSGSKLSNHKGLADATTARIPGIPTPVVMMKSRSYMNNSGGAVAEISRYYRISPTHLIVIYDDLDLEPGQIRLKSGGGSAGHNGIKSIDASLGTRDYLRVRVGIGRPPGRMQSADYVLSDFPAAYHTELSLMIGLAADAVECLIVKGLSAAQNAFHTS